jgi:MFS family permease
VAVTPYREILAVPRLAPLLAATVLARLPIGINGLAIVLFLRAQTGSFAVAGAAAGALALGNGVGAPLQGRVVDRFGRGMLVPLALAHAAGLMALLLLGRAGAPPAALMGSALTAGLALPPASAVLRALYPRLLAHAPQLVSPAFALDSVLTELLFVLGPLATAVLVAVVDPGAALVLSAGVVVTGTIWFVAALPAPDPALAGSRHRHGLLGALRSPGIVTLVLTMLPVGFGLGAIEVVIPAFTHEHGRPELAGVLMAVWALGSAAGGLAYGVRSGRIPLSAAHLRLTTLLPLALAPMLLAPSLAVMALLVIPAGMFIAPLFATRNELVGTAAPPGALTEAYTWPLTALVAGIALGAAAAGALADASGWQAGVLAAVAGTGLGAVVAFARRSTLERERPGGEGRLTLETA